MTSYVDHHDRPPDRKATLFCQQCGHSSAPSGDWIVRDVVDGYVYDCPDCGHEITHRKRFDRTSSWVPADD
ncbi:hypothetical protein [Natrialbaceae archaeon AArc-T1-2]|uniref:hypothetical protein n=1 Tax=Natrialbaceae archaeon AArc-T1-2 TaxID=3053904 RepID=UPI00255A8B2A|nr:hypothetical protein [Natrialbaceae archaeon AArc-T1-2]WIV67603.1 hypothetical protein QQ977_02405 [Natrialbaceae archaeon AArc-T1-2]